MVEQPESIWQMSWRSCWRFFSRTKGTGSPEKSAAWISCQKGESCHRPRFLSLVGMVCRSHCIVEYAHSPASWSSIS